MALSDVKGRLSKLTGLTVSQITENWGDIITEATNEIDSKLRDDINKETVSGRLDVAYAALSFYKYALYNAEDTAVESFSAGDVSIKCNKKALLDRAYNVWQEAKTGIYALLNDENFLFKRTVDC